MFALLNVRGVCIGSREQCTSLFDRVDMNCVLSRTTYSTNHYFNTTLHQHLHRLSLYLPSGRGLERRHSTWNSIPICVAIWLNFFILLHSSPILCSFLLFSLSSFLIPFLRNFLTFMTHIQPEHGNKNRIGYPNVWQDLLHQRGKWIMKRNMGHSCNHSSGNSKFTPRLHPVHHETRKIPQ